jgi:ATP-dependent RNA helicase DeaD
MNDFNEFGLDETILKALQKIGYQTPSPIQTQTIPIILRRKDLIAIAKTGSGKTAACAIPICQLVDVSKPQVQGLIVVPTRELALQYATEVQKIGLYRGVKVFALFGGEDASLQRSKLASGVHVLVATPGRLIDFIHSRQIDLSHVQTIILDEADEMLSMGFYDDLLFIIQCLVQEHQTLLFSATMPKEIREIAKQQMKGPEEIALNLVESTPENIQHKFLYCPHHARERTLNALIAELQPQQSIIFCQSRFQCENLCRALQKSNDGVDFLHAGLNQDVRTIITNKFRSKRIKILVATDVAARGLDFSGVTHVFIFQLSEDPNAYVHRSGRTGRNDRHGVVISLVTDRELRYLPGILSHIKRQADWIGKRPKRFPPAAKS